MVWILNVLILRVAISGSAVSEGRCGRNLFVELKRLRTIKPREIGRDHQFFRLSGEGG